MHQPVHQWTFGSKSTTTVQVMGWSTAHLRRIATTDVWMMKNRQAPFVCLRTYWRRRWTLIVCQTTRQSVTVANHRIVTMTLTQALLRLLRQLTWQTDRLPTKIRSALAAGPEASARRNIKELVRTRVSSTSCSIMMMMTTTTTITMTMMMMMVRTSATA